MEDTDVAWAAGFIDGEGCITIGTRLRTRNRRDYSLSLQVGQIDPRPLRRLEAMFGGTSVPKATPTGRRPMWMWRVTGSTAAKVLATLRPFLMVKADQADTALAFYGRMGLGRKGRSVSPEETTERLRLLAELKHAKWREFEAA